MTPVPDLRRMPPPDAEPAVHYEASDLGNARRLVDIHGQDLRWIPEMGRWVVWDEGRWQTDVTGEVVRRAKTTLEVILDEARAAGDQNLFRFGIRSQGAGGIRAAIELAGTEPGVPVLVDHLDTDPWLLTVANGTLNLRDGHLRAHRRQDLITKAAPVAYDPTATAPVFDRFLQTIQPDPEVRGFLARFVGYCLTGEVSEQVLVFGHGAGSNGKSVLGEILEELLGEHAAPAPPRLLVADRHAEHPTAIASLQGRRLVIAQELDQGDRLDEPTVKQLTGGDRLTARFMRQDFFSFRATHKLLLLANHRPAIRGNDHGIWRRVKLVPFNVTIPDDQQDKQLVGKLRRELPGILNWAVAGCLDWQQRGLDAPEAVTAATAAYRQDQDVIGQFLADTTTRITGSSVGSTALYEAYVRWCAEQGISRPLSQKALAGRLEDHNLTREKDRQDRAWWVDLGLVSDRKEKAS